MSDILDSLSELADVGVGLPAKVFGQKAGTLLDPVGTIADRKLSGPQLVPAEAPAAPVAEPGPATLITPAEMPSITGADQRVAKRRAGAQQLSRKGRASTILTSTDSLGPGPG